MLTSALRKKESMKNINSPTGYSNTFFIKIIRSSTLTLVRSEHKNSIIAWYNMDGNREIQ